MSASPGISEHPVLLLGGGIGAGKSRVGSVFAARGFELIESDKVGHSVLEHNVGAIAAIADLWPGTVIDGVVDRPRLAQIVFADAEALAHLEAITHPAIGDALVQAIEVATGPVVVEIPLMKILTEGPYLRVAVVADAAIREERAVARGAARTDVRRRMSHQATDAQWVEWADRVIDNSLDWETAERSVDALIDEVLADG